LVTSHPSACRRRARLLLPLAFGVFLAGCAQDEGPPLENFTPKEIYDRAEFELETGNLEESARFFSEVERLYPYSEWAKRALIMQAFALHSDRQYEDARAAAQRFIDFYPADEDAAYAQYLLALTYYDQIGEVGRDQGVTFQALQALRGVIERYPDSEYARAAILKFDLAFDHLAGKEMEIGRFYLKRGYYAAAVNRFRVVVEDFQTTSHTPEALYRLVEAYLGLGLTNEAQTAGAILGFNYQGTEWYQDAFTLLTGEGLLLEPASQGWLRGIWRQSVQGRWL
jgi:outer membrane protein assembly factor BamD